jgi:hypothetical protein
MEEPARVPSAPMLQRTYVTPNATPESVQLMSELKFDLLSIARLAKALVFVCGKDHPTTVGLRTAAESGTERDIKNARALFLRLKPSDRQAALAMLDT